MEEITLFSGFVTAIISLVLAAALTYIVLTNKIDEGPIIKTGLVLAIGGLLATAALVFATIDDGAARMFGLWNATLLARIGMLVAVVGFLARRQLLRRGLRRRNDWVGNQRHDDGHVYNRRHS